MNKTVLHKVLIFIFLHPVWSVWGRRLGYEGARNAILQAEDLMLLGGRIHLTPKEELVDDIFMKEKLSELSKGFKDPKLNAASMHFFKGKDLIEKSNVFKILKKMPKGALLHVHGVASVSSDWLIRNLTYMPGLMRCTKQNGHSILSFRKAPKEHKCSSKYVLVSDERKRAENRQRYDQLLEKLINLYTPYPEVEFSDINVVWDKFENMFGTIGDAVQYLPAYRAFYRQMLQELYDDNIMYAEVRGGFKEVYSSESQVYSIDFGVRELQRIVEDFRETHPNFLGIKIIVSMSRFSEPENVRSRLNEFDQMRKKYPGFIIGFDLVGQEDKGKPLYHFLDVLKNNPHIASYFFHAGETNWYGASTDVNLLDAILLNTTRIGHGFALMKHPVLWNRVKRQKIAIEISPISNQVLKLVWDLRNHPATFYISEAIPIIICNDDPGFWNARGLSYDFYYAIMSMSPNNAGLKTLKKLVWNSIEYSILNKIERGFALQRLDKMWNKFLDTVINEYHLQKHKTIESRQ